MTQRCQMYELEVDQDGEPELVGGDLKLCGRAATASFAGVPICSRCMSEMIVGDDLQNVQELVLFN
jgi:hypothetical protein